MALNPTYVEIIAQQWMRDDVATITNTYPDHEDIQGPRGVDLPYVMNRFIPRNAVCFTAEHTMRPVLEQEAKRKGTRLHGVDWREAAMIPEDVLARYPYNVHPANLALVTRMAQSLGIEREFAWKEIADWIVPDLGVLKVFPIARHHGRRLEFSNGHSANERHGFNANWKRLGLDRHDPRAHPERWLITVVNNRGDRIARSKVFADCMVHDVRVHRHVLIGTNLNGLVGYVQSALRERLAGLRLLPAAAPADAQRRGEIARARLERELHLLCWEVYTEDDVWAKLRCMLEGLELAADRVEALLEDAALRAALRRTRVRCTAIDPLLDGDSEAAHDAAWDAALAAFADRLRAEGGLSRTLAEAVTHWLDRYVRELRTLEALQAQIEVRLPHVRCGGEPNELDRLLRAFVHKTYMDKLLVLDDPLASGDRIIDFVARHCPPGLHTHIHGAQNIKGPGLDWCYRWISLERVMERIEQLEQRDPRLRRDALAWLATYGEYGVVDAPLAIEAIERAQADPRNQELAFQAQAAGALAQVRAAYRDALARLRSTPQRTSAWKRRLAALGDQLLAFVERLLDAGDSRVRRRQADAILRDLVNERISHERAAARLRELVARQKGGWLKKALQRRWEALQRQLGHGTPWQEPPAAPDGTLPEGADSLAPPQPDAPVPSAGSEANFAVSGSRPR